MNQGQILVARPVQLDPVPQNYVGVFDTAKIGDMFVTPQNNFGNESPRAQYAWYPMNWRVRRRESKDVESWVCSGLVAGSWCAEEEWIRTVYLL